MGGGSKMKRSNRNGATSPAASGPSPKVGRRTPGSVVASGGRFEAWIDGHKTALLASLCAIAAVRIFLFNAAFPFFNNVDEQQHFDTVYAYAHGHMPVGIETFREGSSKLISLYMTLEYMRPPESFPGGRVIAPNWTCPPEERDRRVEIKTAHFVQLRNQEDIQPPLYYAAAGLCYRVCESLGLSGWNRIYGVRFLNVLIFVAMMLTAYHFLGRLYPGQTFLQVGAVVLLAFLPNPLYYSISNDVPSALVVGATFFGLVDIVRAERKSYLAYALVGAGAAASMLTKLTNAPLLLVLGIVAALRLQKARRTGAVGAEAGRLLVMAAVAILPLAAWLVRNEMVLGDWTGTRQLAEGSGWTVLPLGQMVHHPIFTVGGLYTFLEHLASTFWRGEFIWGYQPMAMGGVDAMYGLTSALFIVAAGTALVVSRRQARSAEGFTDILSLALVGASLAMLAVMSIRYDYGDCIYPSRAFPFFASGRLISGILLPFLALYLGGMDFLLRKLGLALTRWAILLALVATMTVSEIALSIAAFQSQYNWFHLLSSGISNAGV
jgi:hypothetical protein